MTDAPRTSSREFRFRPPSTKDSERVWPTGRERYQPIRPRLSFFSGLSKRTTVTLALVIGLTCAFAYATYLSYYGSQGLYTAFGYQSDVVDALRDTSLLEVQQFDRGAEPDELVPYQALLRQDLQRIDKNAETPEQRAPAFDFKASRRDYEKLTDDLLKLQSRGTETFESTVRRNESTRDLSNAMFALVALLFAVLVGRLRRAIEEGRSLVERLQRAFISVGRTIPNIDLGSVLISATRGSNVGGDTHDAFTFDRRHGMFLVADVSGKGIDAAVDTALIKYTIRTLFSEDTDPGRVLDKFAKIYVRTAQNPETFVVLFLGVVDLHDGTFRYASAGHEPAWIVRGTGVALLPPTGPIVGIDTGDAYHTHAFALAPNDAVVVSTDGLTESRDARGRLLGAETVRQWLGELSGSAQAMADAVVRRLRRRSSRITDDLAILVIRYQPAAADLAPAPVAAVPVLSQSEATGS